MNDNDIEKLLQRSAPRKPRRALSSGFTARVVSKLGAAPRRKKREWWQRYIHIPTLRLLPKPLMVALVAVTVLATGGVAYAAVSNWTNITSVFRGETHLPNGNRIVAVDTQNCNYFDNPDPESADKQETVYYEIKSDSILSNEHIVDMIKGVCEQNRANDVISTVIQPFLRDGQIIMSGTTSRVQEIGGGKITLLLDSQLDPSIHYIAPVTYTLNDDVKVYDGAKLASLDSVKAEDSVILIVRDHRSIGSEVDHQDPNHWDDPELLTVLAIVEVPALSGSPDTFYRHLGTDFVRTEPCDSHPSGFCRAYDFVENTGG